MNQELNDRFRKLVVLNQGSGPDLQFQRKEHSQAHSVRPPPLYQNHDITHTKKITDQYH